MNVWMSGRTEGSLSVRCRNVLFCRCSSSKLHIHTLLRARFRPHRTAWLCDFPVIYNVFAFYSLLGKIHQILWKCVFPVCLWRAGGAQRQGHTYLLSKPYHAQKRKKEKKFFFSKFFDKTSGMEVIFRIKILPRWRIYDILGMRCDSWVPVFARTENSQQSIY